MKTEAIERPPTAHRDYFLNLTPGKLSGLKQITDASHRFKVFALDQSNSFKKALRRLHENLGDKSEPAYEEIRDAKLEMVETLGRLASAILLDVNYGARQALNSLALPHGVGLIVRVEASRDAGLPGELEPGWGAEKIKRMGASAVKLLVYLDAEDKKNTEAQLKLAESVCKNCREQDILLMIEELSYPRAGEEKTSRSYLARRTQNILEATRLIGPYADILKLEFPADIRSDPPDQIRATLKKLNEAAMRPWVLLSAGEKFDLFIKQAEFAMLSGCSGYMAGRAIFNEYFEHPSPQERSRFLKTTGADRMKSLNALVDRHACSWLDRYRIRRQDLAQAFSPQWYREIPATPGGRSAEAEAKGDY